MQHKLNGKDNEIGFLCEYEIASFRFGWLVKFIPFGKDIAAKYFVRRTVRKYKKLMTLKKSIHGRKYGFAIAEKK